MDNRPRSGANSTPAGACEDTGRAESTGSGRDRANRPAVAPAAVERGKSNEREDSHAVEFLIQ